MSEFDAILIPGGGVRDGGELPVWTKRRLDRALERHRGEYLLTLSVGTPHRPAVLDEYGRPVLESHTAAKYLADRGAPVDKILTETCSLDTVGNAYFSLVIHALPQGWRRMLVITSEFHMARTQEAFRWVYALAGAGGPYDLHFEEVTDAGIDGEVIAARRRKEQDGLEKLQQMTTGIKTLPDFHRWLFSEHTAYAFGAEQAVTLAEPATRESY